GYAINIMGDAASLKVHGKKALSVFRARIRDKGSARSKLSPAQRHFCSKCGSGLWVWDPRWPEHVYPFASAIDTKLPEQPEEVEIRLGDAASWSDGPRGRGHSHFREYPSEGIADWHSKRGLAIR